MLTLRVRKRNDDGSWTWTRFTQVHSYHVADGVLSVVHNTAAHGVTTTGIVVDDVARFEAFHGDGGDGSEA